MITGATTATPHRDAVDRHPAAGPLRADRRAPTSARGLALRRLTSRFLGVQDFSSWSASSSIARGPDVPTARCRTTSASPTSASTTCSSPLALVLDPAAYFKGRPGVQPFSDGFWLIDLGAVLAGPLAPASRPSCRPSPSPTRPARGLRLRHLRPAVSEPAARSSRRRRPSRRSRSTATRRLPRIRTASPSPTCSWMARRAWRSTRTPAC